MGFNRTNSFSGVNIRMVEHSFRYNGYVGVERTPRKNIYFFLVGLYHQGHGCDVGPVMQCQQKFTESLGVQPGGGEAVAAFQIKTEEQLDEVCG